jgi:large subunit ribosomal protein L21e
MPHSHGKRQNTRDKYSMPFRRQGLPGLAHYMTQYKVGDLVDIKNWSTEHKGMAAKQFHGRTGIVFNVSKRAVGVVVNKLKLNGGNRIMKKYLNIRVEHVRPSSAKAEITARVIANEAHKTAWRKAGSKDSDRKILKRLPRQPKEGYTLVVDSTAFMTPVPFVQMV